MEERLRAYRSDLDLNQSGKFEHGTFVSRWYQGLGDGMEWLRLTLTGVRNAFVRVYAADDKDDADAAPVLERRAKDLILYGVRGRFLRFTVRPVRGLTGYTLSFPGKSIDSGLPFAMQGDETLRKYLGIFQSLYMDLGQEFAEFSDRMDPLGHDPLPELASWVGAGDWMRGAPPSLEGRVIAAASMLDRLRGTRQGLELLLRTATGGRGRLVEAAMLDREKLDTEERVEFARLYGNSPYDVVLLLPDGTSEEIVRYLNRILKDFLPMGLVWRLIPLEGGAPMDDHCYMDGNAKLIEPSPSMMDGEAVMNGATME